jgi:hypothetical protein
VARGTGIGGNSNDALCEYVSQMLFGDTKKHKKVAQMLVHKYVALMSKPLAKYVFDIRNRHKEPGDAEIGCQSVSSG